MKLQFDEDVAIDVGVDCAIMYSNLLYRCEKNKANEKHYYDGHYWTYNSTKAFTILFKFRSEKQIRRILENLEEKGYIKVGNYNTITYDRTKWYTCICPNGQMETPKQSNGNSQMGRPIPNDNTFGNTDDIKPKDPDGSDIGLGFIGGDIKNNGLPFDPTGNGIVTPPGSASPPLKKSYHKNEIINQKVIEFIEYRKQRKRPMVQRSLTIFLNKLFDMYENYTVDELIECFDRAMESGRLTIFPPNIKESFGKKESKKAYEDPKSRESFSFT